MRALVTGATGFVGMWVARALLEGGDEVRVLARPGSNRRNLAGLGAAVVEGDLLDAASLAPALEGCDELYHVAAYYSTKEADAPLMYQINVAGTKALLTAARRAGVRRVVYTSTVGTIGVARGGTLPDEETEFNLWECSSHYARSKYLAETMVQAMADGGLPVVIVNPCAPVGAGDVKPSSTGQRIVDYLSGRSPSFLAGGINFVPVRDVAAGHVLAARRGQPGRRYLLGCLQGNLGRADFCRLMQRASGARAPRERGRNPLRWLRSHRPAAPRGAQPAALVCRPARAVEELGMPQTPLEDAFVEAVAWFRQNNYVH